MILGIDVGGGRIRIGGVEGGKVINAFSENTDKKHIPDQIISLINRFNIEKIEAIGIGIAGQIKDGIVLFSPNIKEINHLNLYGILKDKFHFPIFIENDANCHIIGEYKYGGGRGLDNIIGIFIGTGIGGGIIINGRLIKGCEIGHMVISLKGKRCGCGRTGCFETLASGTSIKQYAKEAHFPDFSASYVEKMAKNGNEKARDIIKKLGNFIGIASTNLVNIFNPQAIILGGGVILNLPELIEIVEECVKKWALFPSLIKKASLGEHSGIIGAALLCN